MNPLNTLFEMAPLFVIFPIIFLIIREVLDHKTRQKLIDKGMAGDEANNLFRGTMRAKAPTSLKWGLVLFLVGLSMIIVRAFEDVEPEIYFGVMLLAGGFGLLLYYFLTKDMANGKN